ncbi:MAG: hypothetical protein IT348_15970 [Candidatus Eisenbacteria bacterium]|nr:hypothetical protein [Candidatus Eisenbacteria bacterium]
MERIPSRLAIAMTALLLLSHATGAHAFWRAGKPLERGGMGGGLAVTAEMVSMRVLAAPLRWLLSGVGFSWRAPSAPPNSAPLRAEQQWADLRFPVEEPALGVFLEVAGRIEFDRAALVFDDGSSEAFDLGHSVRGRGLYELAMFAESRRIAEVRVHARAASPLAHVGVRLGR